jgi:hypothetical protein|nr:MAG TPA: hypothetical protein [Caudoviricetes sp.]
MTNGVLYVKYINDNQARNAKGLAVHIWQGVKDYYFLTEGLNLLKIELHDQGRNIVYIPMSNVALIEYFDSMHDFEKVYPKGNGFGY